MYVDAHCLQTCWIQKFLSQLTAALEGKTPTLSAAYTRIAYLAYYLAYLHKND